MSPKSGSNFKELRWVFPTHEKWSDCKKCHYTQYPSGLEDLPISNNAMRLFLKLWGVASYPDPMGKGQDMKAPEGLDTIPEIEVEGQKLDDFKWTRPYYSIRSFAESRFQGDFFSKEKDPKGNKLRDAMKELVEKDYVRMHIDEPSSKEYWYFNSAKLPKNEQTSIREKRELEERKKQRAEGKAKRLAAKEAKSEDSYDTYF